VHGFLWFLGVYPVPAGTSAMYQLWSGLIPALAVLSLAGGLVTAYRRATCHVGPCYRIGRYPVAGGQFKVCRRHHPDETVRNGDLTAAHLHRMHRERCREPS
jgi:hypothetical protein